MKPIFKFILAAALVTLLACYFLSKRGSPPGATQALNDTADKKRETVRPTPRTVTLISETEDTQLLNAKNSTAQKDIEILDGLLRLYRQAMKGNPVGLNEEITAALLGRNRKGVAVLPKNHPAISPDGELLDRWGSPYFFHALSGTHMEIRSPGPDRKRYTADDILSQH